ncbi:MAG: flagellin [Myxococcota bacterium]
MAITMHNKSSSLVAKGNVSRTRKGLDTSIERISSGLRINAAADDAAGMASFTRDQVLMDAGSSMLAQANAQPQTALTLLG